jgi:hypothetical protein
MAAVRTRPASWPAAVEFLIEKGTTSSIAAAAATPEIREYRIEDVALAAWPP